MKRIIYILFSFYFLIGINSNAQTPKIDSLNNILKSAKEDSNKVNILSEIAYNLAYYNSKTALDYAKLGIFLANKLGYKQGLAYCYKAIGVIYYYQEDFEQALQNYFHCLEISKEINNKKLTSLTFYNIGAIYYFQGNYDLAHDNYSKSLQLEEELGNDFQLAKVLNNLSILYQEQGKYPLALENYLKSLKIYKQHNDSASISRAYNNIGLTYMYQGTYDQALDYFFKSRTINDELNDSVRLATVYDNIGSIYDLREDYDKALDYFNKSVSIFENLNEKYNLSQSYNHIGVIYRKKGNYDKALEVFTKSLHISEELGDKSGVSISLVNIGDIYNQQKKYKKALDYFFRSLKISKEIGDANFIGSTNRNIGEIYFSLKQYNKALNYFKNAKAIAHQIGALEGEKDAAEALSRTYSKLNLFKLAYQNHLLYKNLFDSLKNDENIKSIAQKEMQYSFDKKQKEQEYEQKRKEAEFQAEIKRQRLIRTIFIVGFVFVLLFAFAMLRSYRIIKKTNVLLAEQRDKIVEQKQAITDSIIYAKRIQSAVLPSKEFAEEILPEHFILFKPRDIVSGDFFWMTQKGSKTIVVAADCTGHGVPGAFMSMLGVSFLNDIVNKNETVQANLILNKLRADVKRTLDQTGKKDEAKDGMDIALCIIDYETNKLQYAGAYNPLYLYRKDELLQIKADKMPIGIYIKEKESFTNHELDLQKGDTFYIFSDGYVDQFGGARGEKFKSKKFKELLLNLQSKKLSEQKEILDNTLTEWRGEYSQLDDICVIGVRY